MADCCKSDGALHNDVELHATHLSTIFHQVNKLWHGFDVQIIVLQIRNQIFLSATLAEQLMLVVSTWSAFDSRSRGNGYCFCRICGFGQHSPSLQGAESDFTSKYSLAKQMALIALPTASTPMAVKYTSAPSLTLAASAPATMDGSVALATGISIFCKDTRQLVQLFRCTGQKGYPCILVQETLW